MHIQFSVRHSRYKSRCFIASIIRIGLSAQGHRRVAFFVGLSDNVGPIKDQQAQTPAILAGHRLLIIFERWPHGSIYTVYTLDRSAFNGVLWSMILRPHRADTGHFWPYRHQHWQCVRSCDRSFHVSDQWHLPVQRGYLRPRTTQGRVFFSF